jgi:DNA modification methylase
VIIHGDARQLPLPDASVDAVVTDPPYELGFMGKQWDATGVAYDPATWREALRVLKPGGHLVAFGGTRTWHRLACAIEDAGLEIRDSIGHGCIAWVQGQGFPKGQNALKPAWEPIVVARRPPAGTVAANVLTYGTGALNIDGCRVAGPAWTRQSDSPHGFKTGKFLGATGLGNPSLANDPKDSHPAGRWPTNVVLSHVPLLDDDGTPVEDACESGCVPGCPVAELDAQSGTSVSRAVGRDAKPHGGNSWQETKGYNASGRTFYDDGSTRYADSGGASRFFPVFRYQAKAPARERPRVDGVAHPCVKPLTLIRFLCRLVTPPGGLILDPFAGSGTTVEAALLEGFRAVGVERESTYLPLIQLRVDRVPVA